MEHYQYLTNPDERQLIASAHQNIVMESEERVPAMTVLVNSVIMALASCLGGAFFFFISNLSKRHIGVANSIACGVMLSCSFDLIHDGEPYSASYLILGILTGVLLIKWGQSHLQKYEDLRFECIQGANARKILLVLGIMSAHAAGEGAGVGVSYAGKSGWAQGLLVTLAIGLHNIPEGLAIATVLISRGIKPSRAVVWNFLAALPQAVFALPSYLFVDAFKACLPFALGLAAGCMIWVVFSEILPDALDNIPSDEAATIISMSAIGLEAMRMFLGYLETNPSFKDLAEAKIPFFVVLCCLSVVLPALAVHKKVKCMNFSIGIGIGMHFIFGLLVFLKQVFFSPGNFLVHLLWTFLGSLFSFLIAKRVEKAGMNRNGKLPLASSYTKGKGIGIYEIMSQDLFLVLQFWCLIGLGAIHGLKSTHPLPNSTNLWHLMVPSLLQNSTFGLMIGLWSLRLPSHPSSILLPVIGAGLGTLVLSMGNLQALTSAISGFVLFGSLQLMCTKASILTRTPSGVNNSLSLATIPEAGPSDSRVETWTDNTQFYQSIGILFGFLISVCCVTISAVLCNWTLFCWS